MEKDSSCCRPVPAPRRLNSEIRKSEYENVSIDSINKCLNINSENIHAITKDKLPNNKLFLAGLSDEEGTITTAANATSKSILTETNDLYGSDDENERVSTSPQAMSTSTPVPAPRKPQNNELHATPENMIYANDQSESTTLTRQTPIQSRSTGAISKETPNEGGTTRRAPELPPKTYLLADRCQRYSMISDTSQSSSFNVGSCSSGSYDLSDKHFKNSEVPKSASSATLNSSIADSTASSDSSKYKSPSPGFYTKTISTTTSKNNNSNVIENSLATVSPVVCSSSSFNDSNSNDILKSLGTTSKLLTESIGERFAVKAKGAKHKLDKNLKTSSDLLNNLGSETTNRLNSVRKRINNTIGTNFSIGRKEKDKKSDLKMSPQYDPDRPQTVPPNDQVFQTISFSSPLNHKVGGVTDLSDATDHSYEVPKSLKVAKSDLDLAAPPSYEDALKSSPKNGFARNISASRSLMVPKHIAIEAATVALSKQRSNPNLIGVSEEAKSGELSDTSSRDSVDAPSPPVPNYPPPALPTEINLEAIYGKLNPIQPPTRRKRLKNYEQIELRRTPVERPSPSGAASLRANIDSAELHQMNLEAVASEREESLILRERLAVAEAHTPNPERSDSWEYYEDQDDNDSDSGSSPEPLYANQEATYGKVFEMASSNRDLLPPQNRLGRICEENGSESVAGAVGGSSCGQPPNDVIQEFDPLLSRRAATICRSDKSNQLLLLEHLLEEDTYGTVQAEQSKSDDDVSNCTSEEDNFSVTVGGSVGALNKSESRPQTVVLPSPTARHSTSESAAPGGNKMQIVHQNAKLRSDSMENIIDGVEEVNGEDGNRNRMDENPISSRNVDLESASRTNWFLTETKENGTSQTRVNPFDHPKILGGESPPSYLEAIGADGKNSAAPNEQKSRAARFMNSMNVFSNVRIRVDALKRKTSFRTSQKESDVKVTLQMIPRPSLSPLLIRYEGPLVRFPSGVVEDILKEMQSRKAILRDRQFQTFLDLEMKNAKEVIPLEYITTLQCVSNCRVTDNSTHYYCFEITTATPKNNSNSPASGIQTMSNPNLMVTSASSGNCKHQRASHLYGVGKESERGVWMQKILESLTNVLHPKYICHYYRAGWCYLKNSITSEWSGTWLVLLKSRRRLVFVSEATTNTEKMDLRKARCIVHKDSDDTIHNLHVESGPMLMIDCPPYTVYMIMSSARETKIWRHIIREVAHNNGFSLRDQQLTKFNVPVIVDKCINFIYIHGSMSEGIYRKSGSENSILKLMAAFRADAFNVEITRNEYNEHDVANVLKRFMRDLPERLMGKLSESFVCVTELKSITDKIQSYKELLARLPVIERETLKKIVGHLSFISSQKAKNKMSVQNLTMIWGPTLLQSHQAEEMVYSQKEADVLTDLITLYKNLFPLAEEDMKKEQEMLLCLQKYYAAAETLSDSVKKSGDLKMWISLNPNPDDKTEEKEQVNVTISPTKTAYEICQELAVRMKMSTHEISLHEIILNGDLERPLHHDVKVFDVVLSWSYWPEDDRKHNYLAVKPIDVLREVQRAVKNLATVTPGKELKFADNRTKNFKSYQCELRDGKIVIFKKEKNDKTSIVREIFLHSVTAYLGCEKKRDFPGSWAITFVERAQNQILRSRESPYIGHVLVGSEWVDRTIWYSSIWYCLYGESILPPAEILLK